MIDALENDACHADVVVLEPNGSPDNFHPRIFAECPLTRNGDGAEPAVAAEAVPDRAVLFVRRIQDTFVHACNGTLNDICELDLHGNHLSARLRQWSYELAW